MSSEHNPPIDGPDSPVEKARAEFKKRFGDAVYWRSTERLQPDEFELGLSRRLEEKMDVLGAIFECIRLSEPLPEWVAREFYVRYAAATSGFARSWDEVFGTPLPKGTKIDLHRRRVLAAPSVLEEITRFQRENPGAPLDPEWDRIAEACGVGKTTAQEIYYSTAKFTFPKFQKAARKQLADYLRRERAKKRLLAKSDEMPGSQPPD